MMGHARGIVYLHKFMCKGAQVITCMQRHVLQLLIWISVNVCIDADPDQELLQLTQPTSGSQCSVNLALHKSGVTF